MNRRQADYVGLGMSETIKTESGLETAAGKANQLWADFVPVIGFVLVSLLASLDVFTAAHVSEMKQVSEWSFALAFVCIGLDFAPGAIKEMGRGPIIVYLAATAFNTVLALIVASIIFGVLALGG